jgi:hypothetical protein
MTKKKIVGIVLVLFCTLTMAYSQVNGSTGSMIQKIDSISKVKKITNAKVYFHRVSSTGSSTTTDPFSLTGKQIFKFDGEFMVMGNSYFNMNKLLFFYIQKDYIEFYFQGY